MNFVEVSMASGFTPECSILNFGPRHHVRFDTRRFLLWPAWAYRVVAPRRRRRAFDAFQRAIMGLCRSGVTRIDGLAEHLDVHRDLAAFIVRELRDNGFLGDDGLPTESGLRALEDDAIEIDEMVAGYVFQDPWSGDLWPRFVEGLEYADVDTNEKGYPVLLFGSHGAPSRNTPFTVFANENHPIAPSPGAIVEAVVRHSRARKNMEVTEEDQDSDEFLPSEAQLDRVSFVEGPEPVYLTTYLYLPESLAEARDFFAADPFGFGQSPRLRRMVEKVMQDDSNLQGVVTNIMGKSLEGSLEAQRAWFDEIAKLAELEVENRLSVGVRSHDAYETLLRMERARQEVRSLDDSCPPEKIDDLLRASVKVLEATFAAMAKEHPYGNVWECVYVERTDRRTGQPYLAQQQDKAWVEARYRRAYRQVGFASPVPDALVSPTPGQIKSVCRGRTYGRAVVTTSVLLAEQEAAHPLRRAAQQCPQLPDLLDEAISLGGAAGHAGAEEHTVDEAEKAVEQVYEIVSMLLHG